MQDQSSRQLRIFISYRRDESVDAARDLYRELRAQLPGSQVFWDISTIEPGLDFVEVIDHAVGSCDVLVALLGRHWLAAQNEAGERRLDDPQDFVRLEIATALTRRVRVIPVLLHGATMPRESELPDVLQGLARRNALEMSATRWDYDVGRLVDWLRRIQEQLSQMDAPQLPPSAALTETEPVSHGETRPDANKGERAEPPEPLAPPPVPVPVPTVYLVRVGGSEDAAPQQWVLPRSGTLVLGRPGSTYGPPDIDLSPDHLVSRRHARLVIESGTSVLIEDLGSSYGTRVGDREIRGAGPVAWPLDQQVCLGLSTLSLTTHALPSSELGPAAPGDANPTSIERPRASDSSPGPGESLRLQA